MSIIRSRSLTLKCCECVSIWLMVVCDGAPDPARVITNTHEAQQAGRELCGLTCAGRRPRRSLEARWEVRMVCTDGLSFGFILNICLTKNWSSYGRWAGRGGYAPRQIFKIRLFQLAAWNWTRILKTEQKTKQNTGTTSAASKEDGENPYRMAQGAELVENTAKGPHITAGHIKKVVTPSQDNGNWIM